MSSIIFKKISGKKSNPGATMSRQGLNSCLSRSANRAGARARAALDAGIGIDHILVLSLRDRSNRALGGTGTAGNALIRNLIRHDKFLHSSLSH